MMLLKIKKTGTRPFVRMLSTEHINRVLIANRGEIALRVMRTAKKLGIETIAVFSDADVNSMHAKYADSAYRIGEASPLKSYLKMDKIIEVAKESRSQAIHPGYGFLSENALFADKCKDAGIIFMGPPSQAIRDMGMKNEAKKIMIEAGVPVIPGYNGSNQETDFLFEEAKKIGFPVMVKAVFGGGGKGMRVVWNEKEFIEKLESARSESAKSFGNSDMILEKLVERPRHVEVQVFGDRHGNYVYLWERDCSLQRRHQKIIEEAPAPGLDMQVRQRLGKNAVDAARAVGYVGAGTVEFIMDRHGNEYFMEMNTRLQVEHPITEAITGVDLVEWQFKVAQGEKLPLRQDEIKLNGHAIETRIYAEDTEAGFIPTAGRLMHLEFPKNARVDTGVEEGDYVTVHYDPMIAKIITTGSDRTNAIWLMDKALQQTHIGGLCNNIKFVRSCLTHKEFVAGNVYTDFIADHEQELFKTKLPPTQEALIEATIGKLLLDSVCNSTSNGPFYGSDYFRLNHHAKRTIKLEDYHVETRIIDNEKVQLKLNGEEIYIGLRDIKPISDSLYPAVRFTVEFQGKQWKSKALQLPDSIMVYGAEEHKWDVPQEIVFDETSAAEAGLEARSPMPGVIDKVLVATGDTVRAGQSLVIMIAMKMEYVIKAPFDCVIKSISCVPGKNVAKNAILVKFDKDTIP